MWDIMKLQMDPCTTLKSASTHMSEYFLPFSFLLIGISLKKRGDFFLIYLLEGVATDNGRLVIMRACGTLY